MAEATKGEGSGAGADVWTAFYTERATGAMGLIGGVFGTYHDAEARCRVLWESGEALATWIEERRPTREEQDEDSFHRWLMLVEAGRVEARAEGVGE